MADETHEFDIAHGAILPEADHPRMDAHGII
jgi:hypothetical protein